MWQHTPNDARIKNFDNYHFPIIKMLFNKTQKTQKTCITVFTSKLKTKRLILKWLIVYETCCSRDTPIRFFYYQNIKTGICVSPKKSTKLSVRKK